MLSSALIDCFTVPLIKKKETQGGKYTFKYFLSQLYHRVIILYRKRGHQGAVINTRGIETAFERSVDHVIVSLLRDSMHKLCLYYGATVLTTRFTRLKNKAACIQYMHTGLMTKFVLQLYYNTSCLPLHKYTLVFTVQC